MTLRAEYKEVVKETEKALRIDFIAISITSTRPNTYPVWVPKSQVEIMDARFVEIPEWLLNRIEDENQMRVSAETI